MGTVADKRFKIPAESAVFAMVVLFKFKLRIYDAVCCPTRGPTGWDYVHMIQPVVDQPVGQQVVSRVQTTYIYLLGQQLDQRLDESNMS